MPTTRRALPADVVEQRDRVGRVVGHRVRTGRDLGAAEPALVVDEDLEVVGEQVDQQVGRRDRRPRAVAEQQPRTLSPLLVVLLDSVGGDRRHGRRLRGPAEEAVLRPDASQTHTMCGLRAQPLVRFSTT